MSDKIIGFSKYSQIKKAKVGWALPTINNLVGNAHPTSILM